MAYLPNANTSPPPLEIRLQYVHLSKKNNMTNWTITLFLEVSSQVMLVNSGVAKEENGC